MLRKMSVVIAFLGFVFIILGISFLMFINIDIHKVNDKKEVRKKLSTTDYDLFYSDIQKVVSYFDLYISEFDDFQIDSLSNKGKTLFVLQTFTNYRFSEATEEQVVAESSKYFSNFNLYRESIYADSYSNQMLFQYQDGKFIYFSSEPQDYIVNSEVISNNGYIDSWILKKKIYFMKTVYTNNKYYNMIYKSRRDLESGKHIYTFVSDIPAVQVDDYKKIQEKLSVFVYTFKRKQNQYFLDNVKMED